MCVYEHTHSLKVLLFCVAVPGPEGMFMYHVHTWRSESTGSLEPEILYVGAGN